MTRWLIFIAWTCLWRTCSFGLLVTVLQAQPLTLCHYTAVLFDHKEMALSVCFSLLLLKAQMPMALGLLCQKYTK